MQQFKFVRQATHWSYFYSSGGFLVFAGLFAYCLIENTGLRYKRIELAYATSLWIFGGLAIIMGLVAAYSFRQTARAKALIKATPGADTIAMSSDYFEFFNADLQPTRLRYDTVFELWVKSGDEDGKIIVWYDNRPDQRKDYDFPKEFFENDAAFEACHRILSERCVNITNR